VSRRPRCSRDLAETRGIDLELLAGAGGVDRRITNPHPQKTGLALSGSTSTSAKGACSSSARARSASSSRSPGERATSSAASSPRHPVPGRHRRLPSAAGVLDEATAPGLPLHEDARGDAAVMARLSARSTSTWRRAPSCTAC
jgi:hypothetical protein